MPLEELIARLQRDADAEVAAVQARSQAELDALAGEATRRSDQEREVELAARRAARRAALDRELASARHAARAAELRARHALLDDVSARASALLEAPELEAAVRAALPSWLDEALRYAGGARVRVVCPPPLAELVAERLARRPEVELAPMAGAPRGVRVLAADGSFEIDDTLPARLQRLWPSLAPALLAEVER